MLKKLNPELTIKLSLIVAGYAVTAPIMPIANKVTDSFLPPIARGYNSAVEEFDKLAMQVGLQDLPKFPKAAISNK